MSEHELSDAQRAFVRDVERWRAASGLDLPAVSRRTKVDIETLEGFERTAQLNNRVFNRVYLRKLATSYARCVGLNVDAMLEALDQAIEHTYDGALARLLHAKDADAEQGEAREIARGASPAAPQPAALSVESSHAPENGSRAATTDTPPDLADTKEEADASDEVAKRVDAVLSRQLRTAATYRRRTGRSRERTAGRIALLGGAICVILALAMVMWFVVRPWGGPLQEELPGDSAPLADTLDVAPASGTLLPETFFVTIEAAFRKVEGMRVQVDGSLHQCWIELENAKAFSVRESLVISSQLARIRLTAGGYEVPVDTAVLPYTLTRAYLESTDLPLAIPPSQVDTVRSGIGC